MSWTEPVELTRAIRKLARWDEDLAQDMRVAAWRASNRDDLDPDRAIGLMVRAAYNTRANAVRDRFAKKRNAAATVSCEDMSEGDHAPMCEPVEWSPLMARVPATLLRMALQGADLSELAAEEGVSKTAIWLRHERACAKLRLQLKGIE